MGPALQASDWFYDRLVNWGLIKPARDFEAYTEALRARGLVTLLGEAPAIRPLQPLDDMERALQRVRQLFVADAVGAPSTRWNT